MKRLLAILGVFALLGTLFVLASTSPASAAPIAVPLSANESSGFDNSIDVTATGCAYEVGPVTVPQGEKTAYISLESDCTNWTLTGVDSAGNTATGACVVNAESGNGGGSSAPGSNVVTGFNPNIGGFNDQDFDSTQPCIPGNTLTVDKDLEGLNEWAGALGEWNFLVNAIDTVAGGLATDACADSNTSVTLTGEDPSDEVTIDVLNAYILNNGLEVCVYGVSELVPAGWFVSDWDTWGCSGSFDDSVLPTIIVAPIQSQGDCEVDFTNHLEPVPLTVTKTFTGRDYYTTVDRADFHLYTPGLCGTFAMDPFGGLLGSVGVFRTINASQYPQVVMALPAIIPAGPGGGCTYRIQENNAPEGCVAVSPDGSNADGPYWEQTWVFGETLAMNFNIVNDCAETPEPTPEPTVAPTTAPKKPGAKKPSSGGTAAPKFTG